MTNFGIMRTGLMEGAGAPSLVLVAYFWRNGRLARRRDESHDNSAVLSLPTREDGQVIADALNARAQAKGLQLLYAVTPTDEPWMTFSAASNGLNDNGIDVVLPRRRTRKAVA